jgi:hypothetical protein
MRLIWKDVGAQALSNPDAAHRDAPFAASDDSLVAEHARRALARLAPP